MQTRLCIQADGQARGRMPGQLFGAEVQAGRG
jgi:hypothetical protein